jgi:hypothetical protein
LAVSVALLCSCFVNAACPSVRWFIAKTSALRACVQPALKLWSAI